MKIEVILAIVITHLSVVCALHIPKLERLSKFLDFEGTLPEDSQVIIANDRQQVAPLFKLADMEKIVPHKFVIVFKEDVASEALEEHKKWIKSETSAMIRNFKGCHNLYMKKKFGHSGSLMDFFRIHNSFSGYFGYFTDELIEKVRRKPEVRFVERESIFHTTEFDVEKEAPWGLSRLSQRKLSPSTDFLFDSEGGEGVTAYVIDTGIKTEHEEFEGRAKWGDSIALPKLKIDGHGHGTHCAGIIGSKTYGVAKKVNLVAVGVMNFLGSGTTSDIIKGVEFAVMDHKNNIAGAKKGFKGSVINMSIGGDILEALDLAANAATNAGLHVAVAAGNDNKDACQYSPARASGPISVGATNNRDAKANFSNFGKCVDIFAPGEDIVSTFTWSKTASMSGTSMASPHIAGLLSYFLSLAPEITSEFSVSPVLPEELKSKMIKYATHGVITDFIESASPNLLAYNGAGGNLSDFWSL